MKYVTLLLAPLALVACNPQLNSIPAAPNEVADRVVLDEQVGILAENAYTAAALAGRVAIQSGQVRGATVQRIADLDAQAYALLQRVRAAYAAGNAASYTDAARQLSPIVRELLRLVQGGQ